MDDYDGRDACIHLTQVAGLPPPRIHSCFGGDGTNERCRPSRLLGSSGGQDGTKRVCRSLLPASIVSEEMFCASGDGTKRVCRPSRLALIVSGTERDGTKKT